MYGYWTRRWMVSVQRNRNGAALAHLLNIPFIPSTYFPSPIIIISEIQLLLLLLIPWGLCLTCNRNENSLDHDVRGGGSCQLPLQLNRMPGMRWQNHTIRRRRQRVVWRTVATSSTVTRTNLRNCSSMSHEIDTHPLCKCTWKLLILETGF